MECLRNNLVVFAEISGNLADKFDMDTRYDDHSSEQYVALNIDLIVLLNQPGDAFKPQAEAKEGNTH